MRQAGPDFPVSSGTSRAKTPAGLSLQESLPNRRGRAFPAAGRLFAALSALSRMVRHKDLRPLPARTGFGYAGNVKNKENGWLFISEEQK